MHRKLVRQMGKDGWLGIGWPKEYGGQGRPATDQFIFFDEVQRARAPFPFVTVNTVGPMIMRSAPRAEERFLSGILAGEINFAIGYTEPDAGTDLASLRTRAVLDGDEWVINGNKVFTSGADQADYIWLAAGPIPTPRSTRASRSSWCRRAIAGFKCTPIVTVGNVVTTPSYYDDVRVPRTRLVGRAQRGLAPDHGPAQPRAGGPGRARWPDPPALGRDGPVGHRPAAWATSEWVQADLARTYALLEAKKLLNWRMAAAVADDTLGPADSSAVKVFGTETTLESTGGCSASSGPAGYLNA